MFTGFTFCILLKTKNPEEIVDTYLKHVVCTFDTSRKILSDNGTEFKNKLFKEIAEKLGIERKVYSPSYRPQANGRIEGFHKYLKECIAKHIGQHLEWGDVTHLTTAAYNYKPNKHSKESTFFLMFGRDAVTNFTNFMTPDIRYVGDDYSRLKLDVMKDIYHLVTYNIKLAKERMIKNQRPVLKSEINIGDLVLVHDHTSKSFQPRFKENFRMAGIKIFSRSKEQSWATWVIGQNYK